VANLATCSWRAYRPGMGVPVRITLGRPPSWFPHEWEEVRLLAPPPKVFRLRNDAEFAEAYEQHLEAVGVDALRRRFEEIAEKHGGQRLVLLCFEADVADCHRGQFARWWRERTGQQVEELGSWPEGQKWRGPAQDTLF
jgi:hypothetical protein